ncbi:hypothetical protein BH09BAC2_BH09BAC2_19190 [soil metagenome]
MFRKSISAIIIIVMLSSCMSRNIAKYYRQNQPLLDSIETTYKKGYNLHPFAIEYVDIEFRNISVEIFTDTMKFIYVFEPAELRFTDTLIKYHLDPVTIKTLLSKMQLAKCTWINTLDYYVDRKKHTLVYMSIRPKFFHIPLTKKKYYILSYFSQPQYFDAEGRLLDRRRARRVRKINDDVFRQINNKVAYTITDKFR